ncbi:winged helix-turn-helix domain-containing protein [Saccharopolyspora shandongensis]|uniref:Helix-turn-helix domain-containing protein n=1 Tax=Saccharopolyspora shandongensis TaxID=418495 RepID=A0A1H2R645_9PSEU|nr:winged helix-turn-helix domain-containing protein [Saccharopolyspora shandongensis]SDW14877.1 Helix-turn-helix domain-containing protein [Saccharopolyspora shandongensis]
MTEPEPRRRATPQDLRALTHPLSWRILRLCLERPQTNQQLAQRLGISPATLLRRVRALTETGFLAVDPPRQGEHGAWERPYRATGETWRLDLGTDADHLAGQIDLAIVDAHRAEIAENSPTASQHTRRAIVHLDAEARAELDQRIDALLDEFQNRSTPDGTPVSILWNATERGSRS